MRDGQFKNYLESSFSKFSKKSVFITGVTSGIGLETAKMLLELGLHVNGVSRRLERLESLKEAYPKFSFVCGDINKEETVKELESKGFFRSDIFINNAGLALGKDQFEDSSASDNELVIQTNVTSAFNLTRLSLKEMRASGEGDIVNICSIASHEAYAGGVVYCATKHALLALGKALRHETHGDNIRVMSISPGMVETEFSEVRFKGDKKKAESVYAGMRSLTPKDVAFQIIQGLMTPRHVNLDEIIILAADQVGATKAKRSNS